MGSFIEMYALPHPRAFSAYLQLCIMLFTCSPQQQQQKNQHFSIRFQNANIYEIFYLSHLIQGLMTKLISQHLEKKLKRLGNVKCVFSLTLFVCVSVCVHVCLCSLSKAHYYYYYQSIHHRFGIHQEEHKHLVPFIISAM